MNNQTQLFKKVINSPIRWAGSKKKLLNEMIKTFDATKTVYVEPFLGSGVVFLNVINNNLYKKYYINDVNGTITGFFQAVMNGNNELYNAILDLTTLYNGFELEKQEVFYYKIRNEFNSIIDTNNEIENNRKQALFWFLMKTGFNGVYRVNSNGFFNVPFGRKRAINFDKSEIENISHLMKNVIIKNNDYKSFIIDVLSIEEEQECFIYMDPPYINKETSARNTRLYTLDHFDHEAFVRFILANNNRCTYLISMEDHEGSKAFYDGKFLKIKLNDIIRTINPKKTFKAVELGYCNYKIE